MRKIFASNQNLVYKPIKIDNYRQLEQVIKNQDHQDINYNGRSGRSYQGNIPDYKQDNFKQLQGR